MYLILIMVFKPSGLLGEETREARMTETAAPVASRRSRAPGPLAAALVEKAFIPIFFIALALLPLALDSGSDILFDATLALAYVVMALGLNIIVGFAGLLDLGYVAFFAIGAYTMGWFGSRFFSAVNNEEGIHVGVSGNVVTCRASTSTSY